MSGSHETVRELIESGFSVTVGDGWGFHPLNMAARQGSAVAVSILIEAGCDIKARTNTHETALSLAAGYGNAECVRMIAEAGAAVGDRLSYDMTPIHIASFMGFVDVTRVLLEFGSPVDEGDKMGGVLCITLRAKDALRLHKRCLVPAVISTQRRKMGKLPFQSRTNTTTWNSSAYLLTIASFSLSP